MALPHIGLINLAPKRQIIQITSPRDKDWQRGQERLHEAFQLLRAQYPDASPFYGIVQRGPECGPVIRCFRESRDDDAPDRIVDGMFLYKFKGTRGTNNLHVVGCIRHHEKYLAWQRKHVRESNVQLRAREITTARVIETSSKLNAQCGVM
ncbi:hypothetical protein BO82DRAFT_397889 [Aspergillus uvarum CBS 121591]|uniref:Uncharacterized protein n=1 Tax=Aspergillus uvarum CBS 121591 TaxID=1448315 RepID=A0A319CLS8_9EURO|nr:hypothetical protein BO82DRAFT_397889 [Aspergillus uvarum CBS 121591]PYH86144.1 hypothetical protein BO82DRAFT_397889 [Aspergillus uvarum CBS 121591]